MNKKIMRIVSAILLALMILSIAITPVYALDNPDDIQPQQNDVADKAQTVGGLILGIAQVIGVAVAIIMLLILAIKYISAAPNDKAEIKKHAVVYVVGAVVLFGASGLLGIIRGFAESIS